MKGKKSSDVQKIFKSSVYAMMGRSRREIANLLTDHMLRWYSCYHPNNYSVSVPGSKYLRKCLDHELEVLKYSVLKNFNDDLQEL